MFVDARQIPSNSTVNADICIVGAGAAGITLAREFIDKNVRVCLLESGGFDFDADTQALYKGKSTGLKLELEAERQRYFGGTTNLWAGYCRPLDEEDFEESDWIPNSGWPFRRSELDPYYRRAHTLCRLGPFNYDIGSWISKEVNPLQFDNGRLTTKLFQIIPAQPVDQRRFGRVFREEIDNASNIRSLLFANVTRIDLTNNGRVVRQVHVSTLAGNSFSVSARIFVLATGGIENARLLLLPNNIQKGGTGNENDIVGRFFMGHIEIVAAFFLPSRQCQMKLFPRPNTATWTGKTKPTVSLSPKVRRREKLLNFTMGFEATADREVPGKDLLRHLRGGLATNKEIVSPVFQLESAFETAPNPDSRVTLSQKRDRFQNPLVSLDWQLTPLDKYSLKHSYQVLGKEFGHAGLGRLMVVPVDDILERGEFWSQHHHLGTTRMHSSAKKGVVDENCQVHGIANLFLAGGSVFPTSASATPTLTIIALAMRLADRIKDSFK